MRQNANKSQPEQIMVGGLDQVSTVTLAVLGHDSNVLKQEVNSQLNSKILQTKEDLLAVRLQQYT